ncbi:MAG TPA: tripartite tricarboxylate transporter substrate binding protein [Burkholderiales bacterium]|nr:tripartite tricarboxylate transporter substrate binding protein [Burkholderiales bacterium]
MRMFIRTLLWCAAVLGGQAAFAQAFPTRPVTIVVPYPPGGLIDLVARQIQPRYQQELGQPVVIENRSGAGGNVGAEVVAHAAPDGYTLLLANPSLAISPLIYPKLNYRPEDLTYVGQYGTVPNVLVVNPAVPATTVQELIAYAKKNPGKLNYASPGYGTSPQMSSELFKAMTDTFIVHIPFRGSGPAQAAMLANETQMMFDNLPPQLPHIRSGKMRALAVTSITRSPVLPDLPTVDESGLKGYEVTAWFGLAAPPGTPQPVVMRLNEALNKTTQDPKVREALVANGATVIQGTPEGFRDFVKAQTVKWAPVVKRANIVPD